MSMRQLPHPITMSDPHEGAIPHKYLAIERQQHCTCCGRTHSWSELYALTHLRPTLNVGKLVSNLRALVWPKYRLPIQQVPAAKVERIPFCHACYQPTLAHTAGLLEPPKTEPGKIVGFTGAPTPTPKPAASAPKRAAMDTKKRPPTTPTTLSDLEDLLQ